jgi:6-pyruvoyltetrahydropterin/6-carboxytetrahydropterin synthase
VLNDLPEFAGLNPSLEHFARILATRLAAAPERDRLTGHTVRLWESPTAWASYVQEL